MNNSPPAPMVHISLFSGLGGFEIAAEQVGWTNAASCEINDFGHQVLSYHFPQSYHHRDVKTLTYQIINEELTKRFGPNWRSNGVILTGGFPCQPASVAGQRLGTDDDRWLWPEYDRLIGEINPDWVCGENVTGILSMEDKSGIYRDVFAKVENRKITRFPEIDYYEAVYTRQSKLLVGSICESLEARGYEVQTFAIPAASVEAPHKRERIWFVAHRGCITGDRRQSSERGSVNNRQAPQRNESTNEFERSYKEGTTTLAGLERQERAEQSATGIIEPCQIGLTPHPISNDAGRYGHGETGLAPRIGKVVKEKRERIRPVIKRIGGEELIANAEETISERPSQTRTRRSRVTGSDTTNVITIPSSNGIRKGIINKQSKLLNQDGKAKGIDDETSGTRRQELNIPGFAAKPGHGNRFNNGGSGGSGGSGGRFVNFPTQSPVCSRNDGLSYGLDNITFSKWRNESIKGYGNAVVPAVVYEIFSAIEKYRIFEA